MSKKGEQAFKDLKEVISVFRGDEERVARIYVSTLTSKKQKVNDAALLVFKEAKKKRSTYATLNQNIDLTSVSISLDRLLENVLAQTRESLILRANVEKKGHFSDVFKVQFRLKKNLIEALILIGKGRFEQSISIIENAIVTAKGYELYETLINALELKMMNISNLNLVEYKKTVKERDHYRECLQLYNKAKELYQSFFARRLGRVNYKEPGQLQEKINKLLFISKQIDSVNVLCYYYLLQMELAVFQNNKSLAIEYNYKLITILIESPAIYSSVRIAYLYRNKGEMELICLQFNASSQSFREAKHYIASYGLSYLLLQQLKVNVLVLTLQYDRVIRLIDEVKASKVITQYPLHQALFIYKNSIVCFLLKEYSQSLSLLFERLIIEKDKEGWNVWIRIMRILCNIELTKLESIDFEIENFRKYLERTGKGYEVCARDRLILKVLIELNRQSFDYQKTAEKRKEELDKLSSTDRAYAWKPESAELVLFHEWFKSKLSGKAYRPNFNIYRQAWYPEIDYTGEDVNV